MLRPSRDHCGSLPPPPPNPPRPRPLPPRPASDTVVLSRVITDASSPITYSPGPPASSAPPNPLPDWNAYCRLSGDGYTANTEFVPLVSFFTRRSNPSHSIFTSTLAAPPVPCPRPP